MWNTVEQKTANSQTETSDTVLLYDAKCSMCNRLAHRIRSQANEDVELLALSDPDAKSLLDEHYPEGWEFNFYLIEDNVARKGVGALPKIASIVGVRNFSSLASDYGRYLAHREQCGDGHHHDQVEATTDSRRSASRRTFGKLVGGAVGSALVPLSGLANGKPNQKNGVRNNIPEQLAVNVVRVRPNGDSFEIEVESSQELIRHNVWNNGPTTKNNSGVDMREINQKQVVQRSNSNMDKVELEIHDSDPTSKQEQALRQSGDDNSAIGKMTRYGYQSEESRYTLSLNAARGPAVADGQPVDEGSLSGEISHDLADPIVDMVTLETDDKTSIGTHIDGYVAGLDYLNEYYLGTNEKLAQMYASLARDLADKKSEFVSSIDVEILPIQNTLGISSLPAWAYYVESPEPSSSVSQQAVTVQGTGCSCPSCCAGCCSGCDCGCSLCAGIPPGGSCACDCCLVGCGGGCGCGCCYCV